MSLQILFLHSHFFKKKKINSSVLKNKIEFLYCLNFKKIVLFFLIQEIKYLCFKRINPKWSYSIIHDIPDKTLLHLVVLHWVNLIKSLKLLKNFSFFNAGVRQTNYTVLRSPFVDKESREQFCFNYYKGTITCNLCIQNFLINEFIITYFLEKLKNLNSFSIKHIKKIQLLSSRKNVHWGR